MGFSLSDHENFDDFKLLFCRRRLRNVHSFKMLPLSYRSAHKIFCFDFLISVAVVLC